MKKWLFGLIGIVLPILSFAQNGPPAVFKAIITDSKTHLPVGFAIVSLANKDLKPVSAQADINGAVTLNELSAGNYKLTVTSIGYLELSKELNLSASLTDTIQKIMLVPNAINLKEVTVSSKKNLIESFGGGYQFNPKDISVNRTGSAVDMLAQVPGLSVEGNDDVKLKGSSAKIMVNGRLINLSGQELQIYLKSIAAERIVNITINTNPSSKYDAASSGGIIDIKLKDKFDNGISGSLYSKYETLPGTWDGANIDFTKNKFTFSLGLTYLYRKDLYLRDSYIVNKNDPANYINMIKATMPQKQEVVNPRIEVTYTIDTTSFINLSANFPFSDNKFPSMMRSDNLDKSSNPVNYFLQDDIVNYKGNYYTYNLNYVKNFKKKDEQLTLGGYYTKTIFTPYNSFSRSYFLPDNQPDPSNNSTQQSAPNRITRSSQVQIDYTLPFKNNMKLTSGLKNSHSVLNNENLVENLDLATNRFVKDSVFSNNLFYKENIAAAYMMFSQNFKKFVYSFGMRYEYTDLDILSSTVDKQYNQKYGNFFPNASFSYRLTSFESIDFSYARKIDRPPYALLDPFVNMSNLNNYTVGNPYLKPSYINSLELQYSKQWSAGNSSLITLSYNRSTGSYIYPITTYSTIYNHIITTNTNANTLTNLSLSIIENNKITSWWQVNSFLGLSSPSLSTDSTGNEYYKPKPYFSASLNNTFSITKKTIVRLTGNYTSTRFEFQAKRKGLGSVNVGIQHNMLNNRLTLNLDVYDLFKTRNYTYTVNSADYYQNYYTTIKSRYASVALGYAFGKSFKKPQVKNLNNDRIE